MSLAGRRVGAWRALAGALLVVGVVALLIWSERSAPGPPEPSSAGARPTPTQSTRPTPTTTPAPATTARPVGLTIPAIGVRTDLVRLGLQDDGTVQVPADPDVAGWYRLGPRPGEEGSAVILGHVDSAEGPAVFARLGTLRRGDAVRVRLEDGSTVRFRVRSVRVYPNADFPARLVYGARRGRVLNLVTCGGAYDAARGGYQANVVVSARPRATGR
jgi:sortase (surface protein transpeptidase)